MPTTKQNGLSGASEDYLKELFRIQMSNGEDRPVPTGELAEAMGVAPPSATAMIRRLAKNGLVDHEPYRGSRLTAAGRSAASQVLRRHRLIETFLNQALGLDWSEVHDEAESLEHAVSDKLLTRIDEFLGHPATDPHGDPIPASDGTIRYRDTRPLVEVEPGTRVRLATVKGHDGDFFSFLSEHDIELGTVLHIEPVHPAAGVVTLIPENSKGRQLEPVSLALAAAELLLVEHIT